MEQRLTVTDRFLYSIIYAYTQRNQAFTADNKTIAKELGKSTETISHSITRLIQTGYLKNVGTKYSRQLFCAKKMLKIKKNYELVANPQISANTNVKNDITNVKNDVRTVDFNITNVDFDIRSVKNDIRNVRRILRNVKNDDSNYNINFNILLSSLNNILNIYINIIYKYYNITHISSSSSKEKEKEKESCKNTENNFLNEKNARGRKEEEEISLKNNVDKSENSSNLNDIKDWWNNNISTAFDLKPISLITNIRRDNIMARIFDCGGKENFKTTLYDALADLYINGDGFLFGKNKRKWKMDFDWVLFPKNFSAIIEKKYLQPMEKRIILTRGKQLKGKENGK